MGMRGSKPVRQGGSVVWRRTARSVAATSAAGRPRASRVAERPGGSLRVSASLREAVFFQIWYWQKVPRPGQNSHPFGFIL